MVRSVFDKYTDNVLRESSLEDVSVTKGSHKSVSVTTSRSFVLVRSWRRGELGTVAEELPVICQSQNVERPEDLHRQLRSSIS